MDASQVEALVRMRDDISKSGGANEPVRECLLDDSGPLQAPKRVRIALRSASVERDTRRDREVNDDLGCLPEMEEHGIRSVGRRGECVCARRQPARDPRKVAAERDRAFRQRS